MGSRELSGLAFHYRLAEAECRAETSGQRPSSASLDQNDLCPRYLYKYILRIIQRDMKTKRARGGGGGGGQTQKISRGTDPQRKRSRAIKSTGPLIRNDYLGYRA